MYVDINLKDRLPKLFDSFHYMDRTVPS